MATEPNGGKSIDLKTASNCELVVHEGAHLEFRFPEKSGFLCPARWQFKDRNDLTEHLAELLSLDLAGGGLRGKAVCTGKYTRQTSDGERAFTFGDPILDLITDPAGHLVIGDQSIDLAAIELRAPRYRAGGVRQIDLSVIGNGLRDFEVAQAALGQGDYALVQCTDEVIELASINPSTRNFTHNGSRMRFRAWKKNYAVYWSMGAEVETWGHDFDTAQIESRYLDTVVGQTCATVKVDSDSDTNDDYLDEYEYGINAPQPLRVVSQCSARWHGSQYGGQVEAGPDCFVVA